MELSKSDHNLLLEFGETLQKVLGQEFESLILYGSAVRGNYVAGKSDVNILIALRESSFTLHQAIADPFQVLRSKLNVAPIVLGMDVAQKTFECFALKFLSIKRSHLVLKGKDIFTQLHVDKDKLNFLAEQELRNLRLRMVNGYLLSKNIEERFSQLLFRVHSKAVVVISDILRIEDIEVPVNYLDRYQAFEQFFKISVDPLRNIQELKDSERRISFSEVEEHYGSLFGLIDQILHIVQSRKLLS